MSNKSNLSKSLSVAVGAAFVGAVALSPVAKANSFQMNDLDQGYQLVGDEKAKEASCGADKAKEGSCGEDKAKAEGKCGEGKCGAEKKAEAEGSCGGEKAEKEGSCGGMR